MAAAAPEPDGPESAGDPEPVEGPGPVEDDVKRRFREALERKQARQADANAASRDRGSAKIGSTHGPARNRRSFRRKSG